MLFRSDFIAAGDGAHQNGLQNPFLTHGFRKFFNGFVFENPTRLELAGLQILDGKLYMHQYKVNAKAAFDGEVWQWHQDYGTWARDDGMPEPRAMNIAVFLDDVTAANGPLLFIPGSHKLGVVEAGHDLETTSYPLWTLDRETVSKLAEQGGCVAPTGPAGSVLLFSSLLVHASPPNISPFGRTIVYLSLCQVDNHITQFKREEWIAHRDFTPIDALADDCLQELTKTQGIAAE